MQDTTTNTNRKASVDFDLKPYLTPKEAGQEQPTGNAVDFNLTPFLKSESAEGKADQLELTAIHEPIEEQQVPETVGQAGNDESDKKQEKMAITKPELLHELTTANQVRQKDRISPTEPVKIWPKPSEIEDYPPGREDIVKKGNGVVVEQNAEPAQEYVSEPTESSNKEKKKYLRGEKTAEPFGTVDQYRNLIRDTANVYENGKIVQAEVNIPEVEVAGSEAVQTGTTEEAEIDKTREKIVEQVKAAVPEAAAEDQIEAAGEEGTPLVGEPGEIVEDGYERFVRTGDPDQVDANSAASLERTSPVGGVAAEEVSGESS